MTEKRAITFDENFFNRMGQIGSILSVMMYVSYIPQITNNLAGNKGSFIQPLVAIMIANAPGIIFGLVTAITALL